MKINKISFVFLLLTLFTFSVWANSPVWKISKGNNYIYIGGTVHILKSSDFPLPLAFNKAYADSDAIFFEVDLEKTETTEFQEKFLQTLIYKNGKNLKDYISDKTYKRLDNYFKNNGLQLKPMLIFKPSMAILSITIEEFKKLGFNEAGVDSFFYKKAIKDRKYTGALESIDTQINFLANMGEGNEDKFINYSLQDIKNIPLIMDSIKQSWLSGDIDRVNKEMLLPMKDEFPTIYNNLIVKRNNNWMPKIKRMFKIKNNELVLVGYLHLVGDDGLLQQLKSDGYKIEMLD